MAHKLAVIQETAGEALRCLAKRIRREAAERVRIGTLLRVPCRYGVYRTEELSWAQGLSPRVQQRFEELSREEWDLASFMGEIQHWDEYRRALDASKKAWVREYDMSCGFLRFSLIMFQKALDDPVRGRVVHGNLIRVYLAELQGRPVRCTTETLLEGLGVPAQTIEWRHAGNHMLLRRIEPLDMDREFRLDPVWLLLDSPCSSHTPSAVLQITGEAHDSNEARMRVWKAMCILKLFRLGSIEYTTSHFKETAFVNDVGGWGQDFGTHVFRGPFQYELVPESGPSLARFWRMIWDRIPQGFFWRQLPDDPGALVLAYERYCDALRQDALVSRRIANAVMGLEALFLDGGAELSFKLRMRVAALLGPLSEKPDRICKVMKTAYASRSSFVHGEIPRSGTAKASGDAENARLVCECLRLSILLRLVSEESKKQMVDLLDASLVDDVKRRDLHGKVKRWERSLALKACL